MYKMYLAKRWQAPERLPARFKLHDGVVEFKDSRKGVCRVAPGVVFAGQPTSAASCGIMEGGFYVFLPEEHGFKPLPLPLPMEGEDGRSWGFCQNEDGGFPCEILTILEEGLCGTCRRQR